MTIPTTVVTDIITSVISILDGSTPLIVLLFGTGISFFIAQKVIKMFPKS